MGAPDATKIRIAGTGGLWKAPLGSPIPSDSTSAWDSSFINFGYAANGFVLKQSVKKQDVYGWQSREKLRSITTQIDRGVSFESLESSKDVLSTAFGGATFTLGAGNTYSLDLPDGELEEFVLGVDWSDGTSSQRYVLQRATLATFSDIKFVRDNVVRYSLELFALKPAVGKSIRVFGADSAVNPSAAVPVVASAAPGGAGAGALVTIVGTGFTGTVPTTGVKFGAVNATSWSVVNDSIIVAVVPSGSAGSAAITVTNAAGASAAFPYTRAA